MIRPPASAGPRLQARALSPSQGVSPRWPGAVLTAPVPHRSSVGGPAVRRPPHGVAEQPWAAPINAATVGKAGASGRGSTVTGKPLTSADAAATEEFKPPPRQAADPERTQPLPASVAVASHLVIQEVAKAVAGAQAIKGMPSRLSEVSAAGRGSDSASPPIVSSPKMDVRVISPADATNGQEDVPAEREPPLPTAEDMRMSEAASAPVPATEEFVPCMVASSPLCFTPRSSAGHEVAMPPPPARPAPRVEAPWGHVRAPIGSVGGAEPQQRRARQSGIRSVAAPATVAVPSCSSPGRLPRREVRSAGRQRRLTAVNPPPSAGGAGSGSGEAITAKPEVELGVFRIKQVDQLESAIDQVVAEPFRPHSGVSSVNGPSLSVQVPPTTSCEAQAETPTAAKRPLSQQARTTPARVAVPSGGPSRGRAAANGTETAAQGQANLAGRHSCTSRPANTGTSTPSSEAGRPREVVARPRLRSAAEQGSSVSSGSPTVVGRAAAVPTTADRPLTADAAGQLRDLAAQIGVLVKCRQIQRSGGWSQDFLRGVAGALESAAGATVCGNSIGDYGCAAQGLMGTAGRSPPAVLVGRGSPSRAGSKSPSREARQATGVATRSPGRPSLGGSNAVAGGNPSSRRSPSTSGRGSAGSPTRTARSVSPSRTTTASIGPRSQTAYAGNLPCSNGTGAAGRNPCVPDAPIRSSPAQPVHRSPLRGQRPQTPQSPSVPLRSAARPTARPRPDSSS
eukprot:gnl/TRDRNA2_/TRDRNA2_197836_c0_seq1.p1 gnl/TRDRNA2_/TRDRNA2_197836_c0~~gnl/TRDRNA2_/TRDRNA2_197836_c0_seq1.p1  ORF type:complete len:779 (+),score=87.09 gnl/TRDRNA2_/TRDRNA2_197836_c0_seq1:126-2339(+)